MYVKTKSADKIKQSVKEEYTKISEKSGVTGCCGPAAGSTSNSIDYTIFSDDYSDLEGYNPDADLNLGCGLPTEFAKIKLGDTVVDLGSGAGNGSLTKVGEYWLDFLIIGDGKRIFTHDPTRRVIGSFRHYRY